MLRSRLVLAFLALAAVAASAQVEPRPDPVLAGPMLADVTHRSAAIWVQTTTSPAAVQVSYVLTRTAEGDIPRLAAVVTPPVQTAPDGTATVRLFGLEPGATYAYNLVVDGQEVPRSYPTEIHAQPLWQYRTDPPAFTVAIGSCDYRNDTPYDRPGTPYGGDVGIFEVIRAQQPDAMLWLGDNVYLREVDWWSVGGIDYRYTESRREPALQALLAAAPHYATWDDHDYGPNDSDRSYVLKDATLAAFQRFWPNPTYGLADVPGVFTQFQWGDAEFFLLDDRYHRAPNDAPPSEQTILGAAQRQWLLDALTSSRAPFKVVAFGGQFLNPAEVYETYANVAPAERQLLLDEIAARRIDGVVFLSGDRHHAELNRLERPGTYPLYEFTSSALTAGAATPRETNPLRVDGTLVAGQRNFGTLAFTGPRTDRTLTMRAFSAEGEPLWEHAVRAVDLKTPDE